MGGEFFVNENPQVKMGSAACEIHVFGKDTKGFQSSKPSLLLPSLNMPTPRSQPRQNRLALHMPGGVLNSVRLLGMLRQKAFKASCSA